MVHASSTTNDADILGIALGAPSRQVLNHAQLHGPKHGWKDGFLSSERGFCPTDVGRSESCLRQTLGRVWLDTCQRLPNLIKRRAVREATDTMLLISGTSDTIPDTALWAASAALVQLAQAIRQEDGATSTHVTPPHSANKSIPQTISLPLAEVSKRLGQNTSHPNPYHDFLSSFLLSRHNESNAWEKKIHTSSCEAVELAVRCQELVIRKDAYGLARTLLELKAVVDGVLPILSRISPEHLVQKATDLHASESSCTAPHQLGLPLFQLLHTVIGEPKYLEATTKRLEALRPTLPTNIRAFLAALDTQHSVCLFVNQCGNVQLNTVWEAISKSYYGPRGLLGLYSQKLLLWQNITHRLASSSLTPDVEKALAYDSLDARPACASQINDQSFAECKVRAKVLSRSFIDQDPSCSTALVTLIMPEIEGLPFQSGDQLLVMPLNAWVEVEKIAAALGLESFLDLNVPLYGGTEWENFARQLGPKQSLHPPTLSVKEVLRYGQISPLSRDQILLLDGLFHGTCSMIRKLLESNTWPVMGTLGDILQRAIEEVSPVIWDTIFDLEHLSWLTQIISVGVPRVYGISSPALMGSSLPSTVKITVSRVRYAVHPELDSGLESTTRNGMTSEALNPEDSDISDHSDGNEYPLLIGIAPSAALRLRSTDMDHVLMFADSSSIGTFRSFWRSRSNCIGSTILFLTHDTQQRFPFEEELIRLQKTGQLEVHAACAIQTAALDSKRLLASVILDQGRLLYDMLTPALEGGLGGHFYVSGTMSLYESIVTGLRRAMFNMDWTLSHASIDNLLEAALQDGRIVLDIRADPCLSIDERHTVSTLQLALRTGHTRDSRAWLAMNGNVYDLTNLHRLKPWYERAVRLLAGLDANEAIAALLGRSSDLTAVLPMYRVARLAAKPVLSSDHIRALHTAWTAFLRTSVESLTAIAFETERLLRSCQSWFAAKNDRESCFSFLGLQARLLSTGIAPVFGLQLQEVHLRTAFAHVSNARPDSEVPDVMGIIDRSRTSAAAGKAAEEFRAILTASSAMRLTLTQSASIVEYAKAIALLEVHLLESIRAEVCTAVFMVENAASAEGDELGSVTLKLLGTLERIAARYDSFWQQLALEGIARSDYQRTQLRSRYDIIRVKSTNGVETSMAIPHPSTLQVRFIYADQVVSFAHLIDQAMKTVNEENLIAAHSEIEQDLSDQTSLVRTTKASPMEIAYEKFQHRKALRSLTEFLGSRETAIKRLSQLPSDLSFAYIMASYGKANPAPGHVRSESAAKSVLRTMDGAKNETPRPRLIRRRTNASSISSAAPQSIFSTPEATTPDTVASSASAALPFQLTLRARDRSSSRSATPLKHMKGPLPVAISQTARQMPAPSRKPSVTFSTTNVSSQSAVVEGYKSQPKVKPMPTLLPSPMLPEKNSSNREQASLLQSAATVSSPKRKIDQVYSFSMSDGPAAGKPRTKHVDLPAFSTTENGDLSLLAQSFAPLEDPAKFEALKRSRTVERIFTHSRDELTTNSRHSPESEKPERVIDQLYSFSVSDGPAAGRPRARQTPPTQRDSSETGRILAALVMPDEPAPMFEATKRTRVVERIFTHSQADHKDIRDIKPSTKCRYVDQLYSFSIGDGPAAGRPRVKQAKVSHQDSAETVRILAALIAPNESAFEVRGTKADESCPTYLHTFANCRQD